MCIVFKYHRKTVSDPSMQNDSHTFNILFPLVLQILALPFFLNHPSQVGLAEGEERKGISEQSLNIPTIHSHGSHLDHGKQLRDRCSCSALVGETAERESISFKENPSLNPPLPQLRSFLFLLLYLAREQNIIVETQVHSQFQGNCTCYNYREITRKKRNL